MRQSLTTFPHFTIPQRKESAMNRRAAGKFAVLHLIAIVGVMLFPVYVRVAKYITRFVPGCLLHDFFFLYCPLCGGTRAISELLHLHVGQAVRYNAFVVAVAFAALVCYVIAWSRLIKGREKLFRIPGWIWIAAVVVMVVFGVTRNVLMIAWEIDPLGDLSIIWGR